MKRNLFTYIVGLLLAGFTLASCLSSNEADYSQYQDCDITTFSVGDIKTTRHTTTAAGKDSTYTETLTGSNINWEIDQLNGQIYNLDSLPVGTNIKRIVATISANGMVARDTVGGLKYFANGTDSLDFTNPVKFRVIAYANANKGDYNANYRTYTVEIRVHKVDPDIWHWDSIPSKKASFPGAAFTEGQKAVELDGTVYVFGTDGTATQVATSTDGLTWSSAEALSGVASIDYSTILADDDTHKFYGKAADGTLCESADGKTWTAAFADAAKISTLLYKENNTIYAVADGKLVSIDATGAQAPVNLNGDEVYLPSTNVYRFAFDEAAETGSRQNVFIGTGASAVDTAAVAWTNTTTEPEWMYLGNTGDNPGKRACPAFSHLAIFPYGTNLVAFGGDNTGTNAKLKGFENIYVSNDKGITWFPSNGKQVFPDVFRTDAVRNLSFSYVIKEKKLWIFWSQPVDGAYIWRGFLNKTHFIRK